ncbi:MAG: hypothetical protein LC725_08375, partial [Lentisphaerae bacterium]|nr:hypothetical protein [Lentisphaerota bacterium]
ASVDSRYGNLALFETAGQKTLYANGQVALVFPDALRAEYRVHFIMAQHPQARRVLLIGGNPLDDAVELLKYPLERLVHVAQDPAQRRLLRAFADPQQQAALRDPRLYPVDRDGLGFVHDCRERFDLIIIDVPAPDTLAANRFYTVEFYRLVSRLLAWDGVVCAGIESSEHLQRQAAPLVASVFRALEKNFDRVLVTPGGYSMFFAGSRAAPLTLDREELYRRSLAAAESIAMDYYHPAVLLDADETAPDKIAMVRRRLERTAAPANTVLRPVATRLALARWLRVSGWRVPAWMEDGAERLPWFLLPAALLMILPLTAAAYLRRRKALAVSGPVRGWCLFPVVLLTGMSGLVLEMVLIVAFQNTFGYIYVEMALIMAVFMAGLAIGALWSERQPRDLPGLRRTLLSLEAALIMLALLMLPTLWLVLQGVLRNGVAMALIYAMTAAVGLADGAQFPTACRLWRRQGRADGAIAWINAADLAGAALGGALLGFLLLPLLGLFNTCLLTAFLKTAGALCLVFCMSQRNMKA